MNCELLMRFAFEGGFDAGVDDAAKFYHPHRKVYQAFLNIISPRHNKTS